MPKNYSKSNWYVITGGPSSGKTTLIQELSKLGYIICLETARVLIDEGIKKGKSIKEIRGDEPGFQRKVLRMKLEREEKMPKDEIIFFDRAIPDSIAYYQIYGLDPKEVLKLCPRKRYKKVFFLEQLSFDRDYARIEDRKTIQKLNHLLKESYRNLGYIS
jgi:predicted ATPase